MSDSLEELQERADEALKASERAWKAYRDARDLPPATRLGMLTLRKQQLAAADDARTRALIELATARIKIAKGS